MADASPGASLMDLPPEVRCMVFGHLLKFDFPLLRNQSTKKSDDTPSVHERDLASKKLLPSVQTTLDPSDNLDARRVDLAIFSVCRTTYSEALPVFYDVNRICVHHNDICPSKSDCRNFTRCDPGLLRQVTLVHKVGGTCAWWSTNVPLFLEIAFYPNTFPRLRKIALDVGSVSGGYMAIAEQFLQHRTGLTLHFGHVGIVNICGAGRNIELFSHTVSTTLKYYSALPAEHKDLDFIWTGDYEAPTPLKGLPGRFLHEVQRLFNRYHLRKRFEKWNVFDVALMERERDGMDCAWLDPKEQADPGTRRMLTETFFERLQLAKG